MSDLDLKCVQCGEANVRGPARCVHCGADLPSHTPMRVQDVVLVALAISLPLVATEVQYRDYGGAMSAIGLGSLTAVCLLPLAFAYRTFGRKSRRNWPRFTKTLLLGVVLMNAPSFSRFGAPGGRERDDNGQEVAVLRSIVQDVADATEHFSNDPRCGIPSHVLLSAKSHSTAADMRSAIDFAQGCLQLHKESVTEMTVSVLRGKERVDGQRWSQSRKESVWKNFFDGYMRSYFKAEVWLEAEERFVKAVTAYYEFALAHRDAFVIEQDRLLFKDNDARARFQGMSNAVGFARLPLVAADEERERLAREFSERFGDLPGFLGVKTLARAADGELASKGK